MDVEGRSAARTELQRFYLNNEDHPNQAKVQSRNTKSDKVEDKRNSFSTGR